MSAAVIAFPKKARRQPSRRKQLTLGSIVDLANSLDPALVLWPHRRAGFSCGMSYG